MNFSDITLLTLLFEIVAFSLAIIKFKKYKETSEKFFLYLLGYTVINEIIGTIGVYFLNKSFNSLYIIYATISFVFYFYWFDKILFSKFNRSILKFFVILFVFLSFYNISKYGWEYDFHFSSFVLGAFLLILSSLFYFSQLLNDMKEIDVVYNLKFWITTGLLLFHVGMIPLTIFSKEFDGNNEVRVIILVALNLILYSCYSIGFILCKPTKS